MIEGMLIPVHASVMYNENAATWERLKAGYEFFILEGNHGAEDWFVDNIILANTHGIKDWYAIKSEMARKGNIPKTEFSKNIFYRIQQSIDESDVDEGDDEHDD
jgi:hypothetical protein